MASKILSSTQMHEVDRFTIENQDIASIDLMERAGVAFAKSIIPFVHGKPTVLVFCGNGNNGGDGFVVSRILQQKGVHVKTFFFPVSKVTSPDCQTNLERVENHLRINSQEDFPIIDRSCIIIDALLGSGITRPTDGVLADLIKHLNKSGAKILSIDIPSGLSFDSLPEEGEIIHADYVGTFQVPKLTFFLKETAPYVKSWEAIDIGLNELFLEEQHSAFHVVDCSLVNSFLKIRSRFSHKGTYGHALLIGGSKGKMGAPVLAGRATLRSGAGLLTLYIPEVGYEIAQISLPEAMCICDVSKDFISETSADLSSYSAIGIGPGLGIHEGSKMALIQLFSLINVPLVIDADAINILAKYPELLSQLPSKVIFTPHPKEFERLVGDSFDSLERLGMAQDFCIRYQCHMVLKDAISALICPTGEIYFNTTGNPGMATGGAGDVLTGMITGLLAQGYSPFEAGILGMYFHGKAGDLAASHKGENQVIASDIVDCIRIGQLK
jgi:ADP-dependent NAD(P)H-hydrate dehydratase / NAD(P)H-hydrate epimerase